MGLAVVFAMTGMSSAQNLLSNGDFELDDGVDPLAAQDWTETHSGGWDNREVSGSWPGSVETTNHHFALGNAGGFGATIHQDVAGTPGLIYQLRAQSMIDAWWWANGYLNLEFLDAGGVALPGSNESGHWNPGGYDVGIPVTGYSVTLLAPAGTVTVRSSLGSYGEGGTVRFDNAVLEVVPEPATLGLLGLSGLALWIVRRRI